MLRQDKYKNIAPTVSSTGGFYNPNHAEGKEGEFYLNVIGIPKLIKIVYSGDIIPSINPDLPKGIILKFDMSTNVIILRSKGQIIYTDDKIFTYTWELEYVKHVKIHSWKGSPIFAKIKNYDQTNTPLNKSETSLDDDSIIIRDVPKGPRITTRQHKSSNRRTREDLSKEIKLQERLKLPPSYVSNKLILSDLERTEQGLNNNQFCHNCLFIMKNNFCEKWGAKIGAVGWCKSWKKKEFNNGT